MSLTTNQIAALSMLYTVTRGRYDLYMLSGGHNAKLRANMLATLTGVSVPTRNVGYTILRATWYELANCTGSCLAQLEDNFITWCRSNHHE